MDFVSERINNLEPYTAGEQINSIIKLNTNENPYPPSPEVYKAIKEYDAGLLRLYPDQYSTALIKTVAEKHSVDKDMVFVGNGSDEILAFCWQAFFDEADEKIAYPDITYSFYPVYSNLYKVQSVVIPVNEDFQIDLSAYNGLAVKGIILANPNAPTSLAIKANELTAYVKSNSDKLVIVDEAYIDFSDESVISYVGDYDNLLVIRTLSKGYSLAGLRCGYAVGNSKLIAGLNKIKNSFNNYPVDSLAQIAATAALKDAAYYGEINAKVVNTRERISAALRNMGFRVLKSESNFLFITHNLYQAKDLYLKLKSERILVRYFNKPKINNYLRISVGTDADMDTLLDKISMIINA
ncbi:MAG: histidinol-phosphate transaminase [Christensenellales bacterium]|jgi:histidinol-phosphate aminotransferase